ECGDPATPCTGLCGGNPNQLPCHPPYCLVSPPIDTSGATGDLYLSFYRWLNSDWYPYMAVTVDIRRNQFDTWANLFTNPSNPPINDTDWKPFAYPISDYKGAAMQFRFCYAVGVDVNVNPFDDDVFQNGNWNIDDVVAADKDCP